MEEIKTEIIKVGMRHFRYVHNQAKCTACCFRKKVNAFCAELSCNDGHFEEITKTKKRK